MMAKCEIFYIVKLRTYLSSIVMSILESVSLTLFSARNIEFQPRERSLRTSEKTIRRGIHHQGVGLGLSLATTHRATIKNN